MSTVKKLFSIGILTMAILAASLFLAGCDVYAYSPLTNYGGDYNQPSLTTDDEPMNEKKETIFSESLMPDIFSIDTVTIANSSGSSQFNNNMTEGVHNPAVSQSDVDVIHAIINHLDQGRRIYIDDEQEFDAERIVSAHTAFWSFEEISQGIWLRIVFATPQFVINRMDNTQPWRVELYDPNYQQSIDEETGRAYGPAVDTYNNRTVGAIHVPLGGMKDEFVKQTWYLSVGAMGITTLTTMGYTFMTYGNYYDLAEYITKFSGT